MFGNNFKYVLVLTALAYIVYTLPTVRAALSNMNEFQPPQLDASLVLSAGSQIASVTGAMAAASVASLPPQPANCPSGYVCIPMTMVATWCPPGYQCTAIKPVIISISATPQVITDIEKTTIKWTSINADNCYGLGRKNLLPTSGSVQVGPFAVGTTTLTLTCMKETPSQRSETKSVYLFVRPEVPVVSTTTSTTTLYR